MIGSTCEWCGHEHDVRALCSKRPTWSRRGFLALLGAGLVGAALPKSEFVVDVDDVAWEYAIKGTPQYVVLFGPLLGEPIARYDFMIQEPRLPEFEGQEPKVFTFDNVRWNLR